MTLPLPAPFGPPLGHARFKQSPEDFRVCEILGFEPAGQGEHLLLRVEKTGLTTARLIDELAQHVGIQPRQVGYAGLKDKQAVTEQWLSLQLPGCKILPDFPEGRHWRVLEAHWHDRKLRVGAHRGNAFDILLRDVEADPEELMARIERIRKQGFANYFGEQRFGAAGDNVTRALRALDPSRKGRRLGRQRRSLYLSVLRSELFNRVLARRIEQGYWFDPLDGDVWLLDGSGSWFVEALDATLQARHARGDIHSGISLYGRGEPPQTGAALALEQEIWAASAELTAVLDAQELRLGLRPHRARVQNLEVCWQGRDLRLGVCLGKGSYLTSLLAQLLRVES